MLFVYIDIVWQNPSFLLDTQAFHVIQITFSGNEGVLDLNTKQTIRKWNWTVDCYKANRISGEIDLQKHQIQSILISK